MNVLYQSASQRPSGGGGGRGRRPPVQRSPRAASLAQLSNVVGLDVVAAAMGLQDITLQAILDGQENAYKPEYEIALADHLDQVGLSLSWLDRLGNNVSKEAVRAMHQLAAESPRKAPIRRANLRLLAESFKDERILVLADALEITESSLVDLINGRLELDEHRFGHINPRLMRAGLPDSWLEQANTQCPPPVLEALETLALDGYEQALEDEEDHQAAVPAPTPSKSPSVPVQGVLSLPQEYQPKEPTMAKTTPKAAATPARVGPSLQGAKPPAFVPPSGAAARGLKSVGRPIPTLKGAKPPVPAQVGAPAGLAPVPSQSSLPKPPAPKMPQAPKAPVARPVVAPQLHAATVTVPKMPPKPKSAPAAAPSAAAAAAASTPAFKAKQRAEQQAQNKQQSLARAQALDSLFDTARRGVRSHVWEMVGKDLAYWGNIRRGALLFWEETARKVEEILELPKGWLDNPSFPPASLAPWVMSADVPMPGESSEGSEPTAAPAKSPAPAAQPPSAPAVVPAAALTPFKKTPPPPPVRAEVVEQPTPIDSSAMVEALKSATKSPAKVSAPTAAPIMESIPAALDQSSAFVWSPPANPEPIIYPGPLTQALVSLLQTRAMEGSFTEQDALRLLYHLGRSHR